MRLWRIVSCFIASEAVFFTLCSMTFGQIFRVFEPNTFKKSLSLKCWSCKGGRDLESLFQVFFIEGEKVFIYHLNHSFELCACEHRAKLVKCTLEIKIFVFLLILIPLFVFSIKFFCSKIHFVSYRVIFFTLKYKKVAIFFCFV